MKKLVLLAISFLAALPLYAQQVAPAVQPAPAVVAAPAVEAPKTVVKEIILKPGNYIVMESKFDGQSTAKLQQDFQEAQRQTPSHEPIYLILNTPGGEVNAGLQMVDNLKASGRKVETITLFAASMGFQTVQGLGERYITTSGILMSHRMKGGAQGEIGGDTSQIRNRLGLWERISDRLDKNTVARSKGKQTLEGYRAGYDNELWCEGEACIQLGFADAVASAKCSEELRGVRTEVEEIVFFGLPLQITMQRSSCPLVTGVLSFKIRVNGEELFSPGSVRLGKASATGSTYYNDRIDTETAQAIWDYVQRNVINQKSPDQKLASMLDQSRADSAVPPPSVSTPKSALPEAPAALPAEEKTKVKKK